MSNICSINIITGYVETLVTTTASEAVSVKLILVIIVLVNVEKHPKWVVRT